MRLLAAVFLFAVALAGQSGLRFDQLRDVVRSSIDQGLRDRDVAKYLKNQKVTFALSNSMIEDFQGMGAGPKTLEVLRELQLASRDLPAPTADVVSGKQPEGPPPPTGEEQERILAEARRNALEYSEDLPDFLCLQITRRFIDPSGLEMDWLQYDEVKARVSYVEGNENYELVSVNNQVTERSFDELGGVTSRNEFGSMLKELFSPRTDAQFSWARHSLLRGRPVYVFSYSVPLARSLLTLGSRDGESMSRVRTGYTGLVYIDKETERTLRITQVAEDIPPTFPMQAASKRLDYDFVDISGQPFLLPLKAEARTRSGRELSRNDIEFRLYRKFTADATISFDEIDELEALPPEEPSTEQP